MARRKHRKSLSGLRVPKRNRVVARGAVVKVRQGRNGELTGKRGIVMGNVKASAYSRAYGREVYVCQIRGDNVDVITKNITMVDPVGKVKRIPKSCRAAMASYKTAQRGHRNG